MPEHEKTGGGLATGLADESPLFRGGSVTGNEHVVEAIDTAKFIRRAFFSWLQFRAPDGNSWVARTVWNSAQEFAFVLRRLAERSLRETKTREHRACPCDQ